MTRWSRELEVAVEASRKAAELAIRYQSGITAETKPDDSPVTQADREGERLIARSLSDAFPDDGLMGEEGTRAESRSGRRWIIDPIDGTRDYVRGNPLWANLIALEEHGEVVAGVVHLPMLTRLYTGARGAGAFCNGARIQASQKTALKESVLCFNGFNKIETAPFREKWLDWMARCWAMRGLGGAPDAMMVASGEAEIWMEPSASPWDFAPLKIILEEAGARYFNLDGGSTIYAGNCVACAPGLEPEVRELFGLAP